MSLSQDLTPMPYSWSLPSSLDITPDELKVRLDFYGSSIILHWVEDGKITTRMERDGVIILNTTQYPKEAMHIAYAIATSRELLLAWEMLPTTKSLQPQFLADLRARHPGVDWQVILDSLDYADTTYENTMPNYRKSYDRLLEFKELIASKGNLSLDEDLDRLQSDLQALFEADR